MADESVELIASMSVVELGIYLKEIRGIPSSATRILEGTEGSCFSCMYLSSTQMCVRKVKLQRWAICIVTSVSAFLGRISGLALRTIPR